MFIKLAEYSTQLQMALAHVPQLEQLAWYVEFLSGFYYSI